MGHGQGVLNIKIRLAASEVILIILPAVNQRGREVASYSERGKLRDKLLQLV
jgi:hypothetical protein